jgi:hypothetical protein
MEFADSSTVHPTTGEASSLTQSATPLPTHPSQALAKPNVGRYFYFKWWLLCWAGLTQLVMAQHTKDELMGKLSQKNNHRSTGLNPHDAPNVAMEGFGGSRLLPPSQHMEDHSRKSNFRRRDQTDPCDGLYAEANTCLLQADPSCGSCVTSGFDAFLTTISLNFTCTDFTAGVCPIIYQECTCFPCQTELDAYFNCVLNGVSNGLSNTTCPALYCDPLKDFEATPASCSDEVLHVTDCVSLDCLSCLDDAIQSGAACPDFAEMSCAAIYTDCTTCLECINVVEPWLSCIAQESFSCDPLDCFPSNTTAPTSVPQALIFGTPTESVPVTSPSAAAPTQGNVPVSAPTLPSPAVPTQGNVPVTAPTLDRGRSSVGFRDVRAQTWAFTVVGMYLLQMCFV